MERRSPDPEPPPESKLPQDPIPLLPEEDTGCCAGHLVIVSEGSPESGQLPRVRLRNREFEVCSRSLYVFPLRSCVRRRVIELVTWWAFDKFILFLIFFNSICLASYDHRSESDSGFNWVSDNIFDPILTSFFTLEFILKVIAFGFVVDKTSYLRDAWNWLDFIVVVTGVLQMTNAITSQEGVGFLRMFRILRPLRSLNAVPQMKVLVNTVLSSIPRLGNVSIMAAFLFVSFGIVGVSLFGGVFHRGCHTIPKPVLVGSNGTECWSWPFTGEERLCGGRYLCEDGPGGSTGFCGGHEQDTEKALRPVFDGGRQGFPWCEGSAPFKVFPESEWICFDHMGSALITIFQCMTLEGWTDVMYRIQDGHGMVVATVYFFLLIPVTSFFLLNVALAVVDEAREDFAEEAADEAAQEEAEERELRAKLEEEAVESKATATHAGHDGDHLHPDERPSLKPASLMGQLVDAAEDVTRAMSKALDEELEDEEAPWWDVAPVRLLLAIATNEVFTNIIMCFIAGNVITMMLDGYPPIVSLQDFLATCESVFLIIFCVEMCIMIGAYGPCRYLKTPVTCFDGIIVTASVVQVLSSPDGQAPFTALRTLRLFRVLNKLASRWPSFRVLLKAMLYTGKSLSYWIVLFSLVLYICTLMFTQLFQSTFHFVDVDTLAEVSPDQGGAWCGGTEGLDEAFRQDCIPRAHFDTFLWSLVSIFQIMTGENWNTIMYAGMRAQNWAYAAFFVLLIIFGQILFLSLFLSMLLSKFDEVQDEMERREAEKLSKSKEEMTRSWRSILRAVSRVRTAGDFLQKVLPDQQDTESVTGVVPEMKASPTRKATFAIEQEPLEDEPQDDDGEAESKSPQHAGPAPSGPESAYALSSEPRRPCRKHGWPAGYAFFIFGPTNPVRMFCLNILESEVHIGPDKIKVFDNAILFCILVSSVGMAMDSPLSDPSAPWTQVIRRGDQVFAVIFALEMVIKLIAYGLFWCEHGYLKDGWNVLDGVVVIITVLDILMEGSGGGFLKTVRILRALRPLRLISRNQNLRVVAQTIFSSLQDLLSLMVVALLFLLIFALFATSMLSGRMYSCSETSGTVTLLRDIGSLRTPLCLSSSVLQGSCADGAAANGSVWVQSGCAAGGCSDFNLSWVRATADTPICLGRCDPTKIPGDTDLPPEWLCPRPLTKAAELPSACPGSDSASYLASMSADETRGREFMKAMQRQLVLPCGGITVNETGVVEDRASAQSCRQAFCPEGVSAEKAAGCRTDCEQHPTFCKDSCAPDASSAACTACRAECSAACECSAYCEPLIKDAALCVEQGGRWEESLSQSFDNVLKAMLTLFEISTTEGWADVMYAACDSIDQYIQPMRDHQQWVFAPFFVVYMIFSNMFIINLSVGVIVDKFMDLKQSGKDDILLTPAQQKWLESQKLLLSSTRFFDITDLDRMPPFRRKVYRVISSIYFSGFIMLAIALHSASMGMTMFPQGESWDDVRFVTKRVFSAIFLVEMLMKLFALRGSYWEDRWNKFDFFCVVVSLLGIVLEQTTTTNITGVTSVFRVARLFRLLNYLKGVKKIFAALAASLPKFVNVMAILLLLLTLYSILGVSLFSTLKFSTLDPHCNFKDFVQAFITLFRGSTGEAWNQIMHDIARTARDIFNSGDWCTPDYLFDTYQHFEVLSEKCLIERPNSCHFSVIMGKLVPYAYWVTYTLFVSIMVMNLVIAVILESYEEGKGEKETEILEYCLKLWKERDPDLTLRLPMAEAVVYVTDAVKFGLELQSRQGEDVHARKAAAVPKFGSAMITQVPMKFIRPMDLPVDAAGEVSFLSALLQVLKLLCHKWDPDLMVEIDDVEEGLDPMVAEKLKMEKILQIKHRVLKANRSAFVKDHVAALKIQRIIRDRRAAKSLAARRAGQRHSFQDQVS